MSRISVIIPVYNTAGYLRACMDSVLAQRAYLKEVILVDDGSADGSGALCDAYAESHPQLVQVIHQPNQGAAAARNRGIERASGECLSFIDSDDYIEPDMYPRLLALMDEYDADMAAGAMWVEQTDGSRYCRIDREVRCCWDARGALIELNSYRYLYESFCTALFRRSTIGDLRFPAGRRCEDYALLYRVIARCRKVAYCSSPVYHYVQRQNSSSRTVNVSLAPLEISLEQLAFFRQAFPDLEDVAKTDCAFARMAVCTAYLRNGADCPRDLLRRLRRECLTYLSSVLRSAHIPPIKKLQALAFCFAPPLYRAVIRHTGHR